MSLTDIGRGELVCARHDLLTGFEFPSGLHGGSLRAVFAEAGETVGGTGKQGNAPCSTVFKSAAPHFVALSPAASSFHSRRANKTPERRGDLCMIAAGASCSKGLPYHNFGICVYTIKLHGAFGCHCMRPRGRSKSAVLVCLECSRVMAGTILRDAMPLHHPVWTYHPVWTTGSWAFGPSCQLPQNLGPSSSRPADFGDGQRSPSQ